MQVAEISRSTLRDVHTFRDAAEHFGLTKDQVDAGSPSDLPFMIHNQLTRTDRFAEDEFASTPFTVLGHEFYWLEPVNADSWAKVGLRGHTVVRDREHRLDALKSALEVIAERPNALDLVRRFITTFVWVEASSDKQGEPTLTSCSLPDLPLAVFISDMALRHIPPVTVTEQNSVRLLAENIYHESVHQLVNYRILTEDLFVDYYDSRTSPKVPIAWRKTSIERNQAWELDRVLHAATVYAQLLDWRLHELSSDSLHAFEREAIGVSGQAAVDSALYLAGALGEHVDFFTVRGALFVGQLMQSIEQRSRMLRSITEADRPLELRAS